MDHGRTQYAKGCRCDVCRAGNAQYQRDYAAHQRANKPPETERQCTKCKETLPIDAFGRTTTNKTGYLRVCRGCKNAYLREYKRNNPEQRAKSRKRQQLWRSDPTNRAYENAQQYTRFRDDPERRALAARKHLYKRKYGKTIEDYNREAAAQGGVCAICFQPPPGQHKYLQYDHDHNCCPGEESCGKCLRGLLCTRCNTAIGLLLDNPEHLEAALQYLNKFKRAE